MLWVNDVMDAMTITATSKHSQRASLLPLKLNTPITMIAPSTDEPAESSESDSASGSDSDDEPPAPGKSTSTTQHEACIDGTPISLPQRPNVALTREANWFRMQQRHPIRQQAQHGLGRSESHPRCKPITNYGLPLASLASLSASHDESRLLRQSRPRSEDRIRAAQHMFDTLAHTTRHGRSQQSDPDPARPCMSMLHGLSTQTWWRNSQQQVERQYDPSDDFIKFLPTMQGKQSCVITTESSTFEFVVTPPSPRPDESAWQHGSAVTGVSITSHKMAQTMPPRAPSSNLQPPPFELAPGRALQLAQRKQRAVAQQAVAQKAREAQVAATRLAAVRTMRTRTQQRQLQLKKLTRPHAPQPNMHAPKTYPFDRLPMHEVSTDDIMAYVTRWNNGAFSSRAVPDRRSNASHPSFNWSLITSPPT